METIKTKCPECERINNVRIEHPEQGAACPDCGKIYHAIEHKLKQHRSTQLKEMQMEKTKTKKQILEEAGYVPKLGRPTFYGEATEKITVRLAPSVIKKIPPPPGKWIRDLVIEKLNGSGAENA